MNTSSSAPTEPADAQTSEPLTEAPDAKTQAIKPFSFPFSPDVFAPAKSNDKPWHQQGNKSNHDQRPSTSPKGSRRSMGKR